jgi:hypothetical protein
MDDLILPEKGLDRVYAVPRIRKCTSTLYLHLINLFGNLGGYDVILEILEGSKKGKSSDGLDLTIVANLMSCISVPCLIYHKDFIKEYGPKFVEACKK